MKQSRPTPRASSKTTTDTKTAREATANLKVPTKGMSKAEAVEYRRRFDAARSFEEEDEWWKEDTVSDKLSARTGSSLTSPARPGPQPTSPAKVSTLNSGASFFTPTFKTKENTRNLSPLAEKTKLKATALAWTTSPEIKIPTGPARSTSTPKNTTFASGINPLSREPQTVGNEDERQLQREIIERDRAYVGQKIRDRALARARRAAIQEEELEQRKVEAGSDASHRGPAQQHPTDEKIP